MSRSARRRVLVLDPSRNADGSGLRGGNRVTALRWARILRRSGLDVRVRARFDGEAADLLVVLNAEKSAGSIPGWRAQRGDAPLVVALTGTDFAPGEEHPGAAASLEAADRVVALFDFRSSVPDAALRDKLRVIPQSFTRCPSPLPETDRGVRLVLLAHVRAIKDPLLVARALERRPALGELRVEIVGEVLEPDLGAELERAVARDARLTWGGGRLRRAALETLHRSHGLLCTSHHEGGAGSVAEAIVFGRPVLTTDIPACRALLGEDYPGTFPVGDAEALASGLERFTRDAAYRSRLCSAVEARAPALDPALEEERWSALLRELGIL